MNSLLSKIQTATPPRGDQGADWACQVKPSSETVTALPKFPSLRFAPTNHSLLSKTIGVPPPFRSVFSFSLVQVMPSPEDQTSLYEAGFISLSPSITPPPKIQSRSLKRTTPDDCRGDHAASFTTRCQLVPSSEFQTSLK